MNPLEWFRQGRRIDWPRVLLATLAVTLGIALVVTAATSTTAFSPYNPSWDGATDLRTSLEGETDANHAVIRDTTRYDDVDADGTVAFVIGPEATYDGDDADRVREFVERGGTLVVLENFGASGNALLADVGADARANGTLLRDEQHYYQAPTMPVATTVENHTFTEGIDQLTLNYATAIDAGNATVLVSTSDFAYLDLDGDGELGDDEELSAYPVATAEPVGDGTVIAVGDPSIVINVMREQPDNAAFIHGLSADHDRVLLDVSHAGDLPPLTVAALVLRETPLLQGLVGLLLVGIVTIASGRTLSSLLRPVHDRLPTRGPDRARVERTEFPISDADRAAFLRRRHPEWDEERIQRVITAVKRTRAQREDTKT